MQITLCNVQSRFLSIITDLTTKPELLSQFSIWVDLRIAEFKTKGQISLECDGKKLEPAWLCGYQPCKDGVVSVEIQTSEQRDDSITISGEPTLHDDQTVGPVRRHRKKSIQQFISSSSADPNRMKEIKSEPLESTSPECDGKLEPAWLQGYQPCKDGVMSVECQTSEERDDSIAISGKPALPDDQTVVPVRLHRKRSIQQFISSSSADPNRMQEIKTEALESTSPSKNAKQSSPSNTCSFEIVSGADAFHVSLAGSVAINDVTDTMTDADSPPSTAMSLINQSLDVPASESKNIGPEKKDLKKHSPQFSLVSKFQPYVPKHSSTPQPSTSSTKLTTSPSSRRRHCSSELYPSNFPERLSSNVIKTRVVGWQEKPHTSIVNMVSAVGTVERWWWNKYKENRNMENLASEELDNYLAEFYQILQKPNGLDYTADSMSNFRCSLERFLKEHQYPYSITKSQEFSKSRHVFTERRRMLATERFQSDKRCIQEEWSINTG